MRDQLLTRKRLFRAQLLAAIGSDTEIHTESQTTSPQMSSSVVADAKWVGACPAGVMPGDQATFVNGVFKKSGNIMDALPSAR